MTANHGSWSSVLLALRSLLWTILLPGFVRGLYRYVRNPMYLSVTTIVLGETLLTSSAALGVYWVMWFVLANLFVIGYEEPTLRRRFGVSYDEYTQQVGRWIPRFGSRATPG